MSENPTSFRLSQYARDKIRRVAKKRKVTLIKALEAIIQAFDEKEK